jgi:hypothetical protein
MISKIDLQSIISKYFLNSLIESVEWNIKNSVLLIKFNSSDKTMIGKVVYNGIDLEDSTVGISNTTQLNKLLSVTKGDLKLEYQKEKNYLTKLKIADNQFNVSYTLADIMIIPKTGEYAGDNDYDVRVPLNLENITAITKAKSALIEANTVVLKPYRNEDNELLLELMFGGDIEYSNKISYFLPNVEFNNIENDFSLNFDSNILKEIMSCNNDMSEGILEIKLEGIMKLSFTNPKISSEYYLVSKDN